MGLLSQTMKSGDWKGEKHVPVIHAPATAKAEEEIEVKVCVGEEIAHPNTDKHHIDWIKVFFQPEGKAPFEVGTLIFQSHDEDNKFFSAPKGSLFFKAPSSGTIHAMSFCNIHGLWENSAELKID